MNSGIILPKTDLLRDDVCICGAPLSKHNPTHTDPFYGTCSGPCSPQKYRQILREIAIYVIRSYGQDSDTQTPLRAIADLLNEAIPR